MEPEINKIEEYLTLLKKTTPLSKYLALVLFVAMPFLGGWIGYMYGVDVSAVQESVQVQNKSTDVAKSTDEVDFSSDVTNSLLQTGTYAVARSRRVEDNEWFDTSILYSPDRGYTWERYLSIDDGYIPARVYVIYDALYFSTADNSQSNFYKVDLRTKEKELLGTVDGRISDFGVTSEGVVAIVPDDSFCLDKPINCSSKIYTISNGNTAYVGAVKGIRFEVYGQNGFVLSGGYGDAGCVSREVYKYSLQRGSELTLVDEYKNAACFGDDGYSTFAVAVSDAIENLSENIDTYYVAESGNSFSVDETDPLTLSVRNTESDRMKLADKNIESLSEGSVTVLRYKDIQNINTALDYLRTSAQTSIPSFNLDEERFPRDMLYPDGGGGKKILLSEVAKFTSPEHCLIAYNNGVHDITILLRLADRFPAISELSDKCGTDVDNFIAAQPVESGSLNTARFAYVMREFWIEYWVEG